MVVVSNVVIVTERLSLSCIVAFVLSDLVAA